MMIAPRTKPADIRRDELMAAAQALFLAQGYHATSVDAIVRRAGVAKGTFYLYFKTKDDVLLALRQAFIERFAECLTAAVAGQTGVVALDCWVAAACRYYREQRGIHDLVFHQVPTAEGPIYRRNTVNATLMMVLESGVAAGHWPAMPIEPIGIMLFHAWHGAVNAALFGGDQADGEAVIALVQRFFRSAIGAPD